MAFFIPKDIVDRLRNAEQEIEATGGFKTNKVNYEKLINEVLETVDCHIEDYEAIQSTSGYDKGWFDAMSLIKRILSE